MFLLWGINSCVINPSDEVNEAPEPCPVSPAYPATVKENKVQTRETRLRGSVLCWSKPRWGVTISARAQLHPFHVLPLASVAEAAWANPADARGGVPGVSLGHCLL